MYCWYQYSPVVGWALGIALDSGARGWILTNAMPQIQYLIYSKHCHAP